MPARDLVHRLCTHLPLNPEDKQVLLEAISTAERVRLLRGLMDMAGAASTDVAQGRHEAQQGRRAALKARTGRSISWSANRQ